MRGVHCWFACGAISISFLLVRSCPPYLFTWNCDNLGVSMKWTTERNHRFRLLFLLFSGEKIITKYTFRRLQTIPHCPHCNSRHSHAGHGTRYLQVEIVKVKVKREPSLGMRLEEVARGGDGRGLVLVAGLEPGGNAEATGKVPNEVFAEIIENSQRRRLAPHRTKFSRWPATDVREVVCVRVSLAEWWQSHVWCDR